MAGHTGAESVSIIIPMKPISKKNSLQMARNARTGTWFPRQSAEYLRYERDCGVFIRCKGLDISYPVGIKAVFYVPDNRRRDLSNYIEAIADILVHYRVIGDDCWQVVENWDGSRMRVDKDNPRTEIVISKARELEEVDD